jgi:hypothetical protein
MAKVHIFIQSDQKQYWMKCPACNKTHACNDTWEFNNDLENPTFSPSLLVRSHPVEICHSFIRNGKWEFLSDCTHEMAGKTVDND